MKAKEEIKEVKELSCLEALNITGGAYKVYYVDGQYKIIYVEEVKE